MANTINKVQNEGRYGRFKSRKARRMIYVKVPGGKTVIHFDKKKPKSAKCGLCGKFLSGTIRELPYKVGKVAKSSRRPERPYGGNLCSSCSRRKLISTARKGDSK